MSTAPIGDRIRAIATGRWPEDPTWIVAYRTGDGRRVVFGRDDIEVPDLATAVEASSAVPGRFRPIRLDSGRYLDGAVYSPTNADLVANLGFDLVIVSAPMAATEDALGSRPTLASRPRAWFARLLRRRGGGGAPAGRVGAGRRNPGRPSCWPSGPSCPTASWAPWWPRRPIRRSWPSSTEPELALDPGPAQPVRRLRGPASAPTRAGDRRDEWPAR